MDSRKSFPKQVHAWTVWFRLIGTELRTHPEGLTSKEVAVAALKARDLNAEVGELLNAETETTRRLLGDYSRWGLVSGAIETRPVPGAAERAAELEEIAAKRGPSRVRAPSLILTVPAQVAKLSKRGERILASPKWRQQAFFAGRLIAQLKIWQPLKTAFAVAGALVTLLKMILLWQSHHVAIVAGVSGVLVFVLELVRARD